METQIYGQENQGILLEDRIEWRQEVAPKNHTRATRKNASGGGGSKAEKEVSIYSLTDPRTGLVRYIGKSNNPKKRLGYHLRIPPSCGMRRWIDELRSMELEPVLEVIERALEWEEPERFWIAYYRMGGNLLNVRNGGGGSSPEHFTEEIRAKISASNRCKKHKPASLEARAKMSEAQRGRKHSPETKAKISAALIGKKHTPEHCANSGAALRGKKIGPRSPVYIAKLIAFHTGRKRSQETCARISAAKKGKKHGPLSTEHRAKISARLKGRVTSQEARTKNSESQLRRHVAIRAEKNAAVEMQVAERLI